MSLNPLQLSTKVNAKANLAKIISRTALQILPKEALVKHIRTRKFSISEHQICFSILKCLKTPDVKLGSPSRK